MLEHSPINLVGCCREDNAGFAADAYAQVNGMGAVCVTYCVGGLSVANSIAGAYAEKSPVVLITGSPGMRERTNNPSSCITRCTTFARSSKCSKNCASPRRSWSIR